LLSLQCGSTLRTSRTSDCVSSSPYGEARGDFIRRPACIRLFRRVLLRPRFFKIHPCLRVAGKLLCLPGSLPVLPVRKSLFLFFMIFATYGGCFVGSRSPRYDPAYFFLPQKRNSGASGEIRPLLSKRWHSWCIASFLASFPFRAWSTPCAN